jgi:hypothetical protein
MIVRETWRSASDGTGEWARRYCEQRVNESGKIVVVFETTQSFQEQDGTNFLIALLILSLFVFNSMSESNNNSNRFLIKGTSRNPRRTGAAYSLVTRLPSNKPPTARGKYTD